MILKLNYGEVELLLMPPLEVIRLDCSEFSSLARKDQNNHQIYFTEKQLFVFGLKLFELILMLGMEVGGVNK